MSPKHRRVTAAGRTPRSLFVDASAWIALISADDAQHQAAARLFRAALAQRYKLYTSELVIAEVHRFFLFRAGIRPARLALDRLLTSPLLQVVYGDATRARDAAAWLDRFDDQVFSYTDAVSFAFLRSGPCDAVLTFDRDFSTAGFTPWQG